MKKLIYLMIMCFGLIAFTGCGTDNQDSEDVPVDQSEVDTQEDVDSQEQEDVTEVEFVPYEDEEGKFKISFPGTPMTIETGEGNMLMYNNTDDAYSLIYANTEGSDLNDLSEEEILQQFTNAAAGGEINIIEDKEITLGDYSGIEVVYTTDIEGKITFYTRFYQVGDRFYMLLITNLVDDTRLPEYDTFFDSFEIIEE